MSAKFDRPGVFRATCHKLTLKRFDELTDAEREQVEAAKRNARHDRKLGQVVDVACEFETTDAAEYLAHMADVHGGPLYAIYSTWRYTGSWQETAADARTHRPALPVKPWKAPKLLPEGKPWVDPSPKSPVTKTCGSCGLVAEVDERSANVLWWDEHLRGCALAQAAS